MSTIDTIYQKNVSAAISRAGTFSEFVLKLSNETTSSFARLNHALARRRSRRRLIDLTDAELLDVGITRQQAVQEAGRPFWS